MTRQQKAAKLIEKMCREHGLDRKEVAAKMNTQVQADARELIRERLDVYDPEYIKQTFQRVTGIRWFTSEQWARLLLTVAGLALFTFLACKWGID